MPVIIESITAIPDSTSHVMVTLAGHEPIKVRIAIVRSAKRFRNAVKYRFEINLDPVPQEAWSVVVEPLLVVAKGGGQ
jgi:hypothetical protein